MRHLSAAALCIFLFLPSLALAQAEVPAPRRTPGCVGQDELLTSDEPLVNVDLSLKIDLERRPVDCSTDLFEPAAGEIWPATTELEFTWAASELYHQPLYFDDTLLERYGQTAHPILQPVISGAHFFGQFPLLPYKFGLDRTHDHVYVLGQYRPGSPTPCLARKLPLEADASLFTAGTAVALLLLLP